MNVNGRGGALSGDYLNFDLTVERVDGSYRVRVIDSPSGEAQDTFTIPFQATELESFATRLAGVRGGMRRMSSPQLALAKEVGGRLFQAVVTPSIKASLLRAVDDAELQHAAGIRIRLRLDDVPNLAALPWEFMFDPDPRVGRFMALSLETALVRYLSLPERIRPLHVKPPVNILVVIANPMDDRYPELNVETEWKRLREDALAPAIAEGLVTVTRSPNGKLSALQEELLRKPYHVLHFIGHGYFDEDHQDGVLAFEGERGGANEVSAERLGALLHNERQLGLAVINACEGARASATDPYAGMAQTLVRMGLPAVVAMQFEISDTAAIMFARNFYSNVARNLPIDAAITHARIAIFEFVSEVEWATPVLYMRAPDGRVFDVEPSAPAAAHEPVVVHEPVAKGACELPLPSPPGMNVAPRTSARDVGWVGPTFGTPRLPGAALLSIRSAVASALRRRPRATIIVSGIVVLTIMLRLAQVDITVVFPSDQGVPTPSAESAAGNFGPLVTPQTTARSVPSTSVPSTSVPSAPATGPLTVKTAAPIVVPASVATVAPSSIPAGTSTVHGYVLWNGSGVSGVSVLIARGGTQSVLVGTDSAGLFRVANVADGSYSATVLTSTIPSIYQTPSNASVGSGMVAPGSDLALGSLALLKTVTGLVPYGVTVAPPVTLRWDPMPSATAYDIWFCDGTNGPPACGATLNRVTATQYGPSVISGHTYYWWVNALNGSYSNIGWSGPAKSFTVQ